MSTERLLRTYIRGLIVEFGGDGGAGEIMAAGAGMSPYGMHFGSGDDLYKIFVKPFTDVVQTAAGKTKELSQRAQTLSKVAFETIATSLIPVLRDSYSEIFAKEKASIDKVRQQYSEVYQSNWDAFRDNDVLACAFLYSPALLLTPAFVQKTPQVAAQLISVLSGGALDPWLKKVSDRFHWDKPPVTGLGRKDNGPGLPMEGRLREDGNKGPTAEQLLTSKKLKAKLQQSPVVQKMEQQGQAIVRNTLEQVFKQAQGVLTSKSLQDVQRKTGVKLKGLDKLSQVPEQERQAAEQAILMGAKKSLKEFYTKNLQGQVKQALDAGVPETSGYVTDYRNVIRKISGL